MKLPIELLTLDSTYGKLGPDPKLYPAPIPGSALSSAGLSVAAAETVAGQGTGSGEHLQSPTTHPLVGTQAETQIENPADMEIDPADLEIEWGKLPADQYYDFQVDVIRAKDPVMADKYAQLKMYESPFVGKIT